MKFLRNILNRKKTLSQTYDRDNLSEKEFDNLIIPNKWHKKPYLILEKGGISGLVVYQTKNSLKYKKMENGD